MALAPSRLPLLTLGGIAALASFVACTTENVIVQKAPAAAPDDTSDTTTDDADGGATGSPDASTVKPKGDLTFPQARSRGGRTITAPRVRPIVFSGDPLASDVTAFTKKLATSAFWKTTGSEFGVGAITAADTITLSEAAPTTITSQQIEQWLVGKLSGAQALETPDENTLYAVYYPSGTTVTLEGAGEEGQSCQGYGGYHSEIAVGNKKVGYAVLPRCSSIDELTVAASHEYFEWATDPLPMTNPAYNTMDADHWAWGITMLGELGDLCTFLDQSYIRPAEVGYQVQRMWSNTLSKAGTFPCAPTKDVAYIQAIPDTPDTIDVPDGPSQTQTVSTKAITIKPGATKDVDVFIYSDRPNDPTKFQLRPLGYADLNRGAPSSGFSYQLSSTTPKVGSTVKLTITAPKQSGYDIVSVAVMTGDQAFTFWPVLVVADTSASGFAAGLPSNILERTARARTNGVRTTKLGMGKRLLHP